MQVSETPSIAQASKDTNLERELLGCVQIENGHRLGGFLDFDALRRPWRSLRQRCRSEPLQLLLFQRKIRHAP
jgi:hypothetical protein